MRFSGKFSIIVLSLLILSLVVGEIQGQGCNSVNPPITDYVEFVDIVKANTNTRYVVSTNSSTYTHSSTLFVALEQVRGTRTYKEFDLFAFREDDPSIGNVGIFQATSAEQTEYLANTCGGAMTSKERGLFPPTISLTLQWTAPSSDKLPTLPNLIFVARFSLSKIRSNYRYSLVDIAPQ